MYHHLSKRASRYEEYAVQLTQQLIRIPSFSLHEKAAGDRVEKIMEGLEYDLVVRDDAGNVAGMIVGAHEGQTVLLVSHLDTVRPLNEHTWDDHPFSGCVRDGRVYGLGAADCKSGVAVQILAGRLINEIRLPLCGALVVCAAVGEANGSSAGVKFLLEETLPKIGLQPDLAILGEPTALAVCNQCDGRMDTGLVDPIDTATATHNRRWGRCAGRATGVHCHGRPWVTPPSEPMVSGAREALLAAGFRDVPIRKWRPGPRGLGTAGSVLVNDYHVPTIGFGPGDENVAHQPNESVEVKNIVDAVFGTAVLAYSVVGASTHGLAAG